MKKTLGSAIFEAEKHTTHAPKHEALSGLDVVEQSLLLQALDQYRVFNIRKFDKPTVYASVDPVGYDEFLSLLDKLHNRELTGNAAKAAVTHTLAQYTEYTAKALMRVLDQDLKCGATISTFRKLYPHLDIREFDLMGAEKMDEKKYKWQWPCIGEAKYDGQRAIIRVELRDRSVNYLSRNGKPLDHLQGLFDAEALAFADEFGVDMILDGEALAGSFQETVKAKGSENVDQKQNLKFYAFDYMTVEQWDAQNCPLPQLARSTVLETVINKLSMPKLVKSKYRILNNLEEAHEFYTEILKEGINEDGTSNGLGEGLIIKYVGAFYQWNLGGSRGPEWTKWKPVIDFDLTIEGKYEGDPGTKNEGKLGGLILRGQDENGRPIKTNCGGFKVSHKKMQPMLREIAASLGGQIDYPKKPNYIKNKDQMLRQHIWDHFDEFVSKTCTVESQEMCLAEGATDYALRFPQFIMVRTDK